MWILFLGEGTFTPVLQAGAEYVWTSTKIEEGQPYILQEQGTSELGRKHEERTVTQRFQISLSYG
jgi:hypothetical protein